MRKEKMRTMLKLTLRCNFCLLIIHTFLERTQPASGMQTAVRSDGPEGWWLPRRPAVGTPGLQAGALVHAAAQSY